MVARFPAELAPSFLLNRELTLRHRERAWGRNVVTHGATCGHQAFNQGRRITIEDHASYAAFNIEPNAHPSRKLVTAITQGVGLPAHNESRAGPIAWIRLKGEEL